MRNFNKNKDLTSAQSGGFAVQRLVSVFLVLFLVVACGNENKCEKEFELGYNAGFDAAKDLYTPTRKVFYPTDSVSTIKFDPLNNCRVTIVNLDSAFSGAVIHGFDINLEGVLQTRTFWIPPAGFDVDSTLEVISDSALIKMGFKKINTHH